MRVNNISFLGITNKNKNGMFVLDLDGTYVNGSLRQMVEIKEKADFYDSKFIYATGRSYEKYQKLKSSLLVQRGILLPVPDYLITENGREIYKKDKNNNLVEVDEYKNEPQGLMKARGVEYLKRRENVQYEDILMAGNHTNDISLAKLSKKGANFIRVQNCSKQLELYCNSLNKNVCIAENAGAKGILEGIEFFGLQQK